MLFRECVDGNPNVSGEVTVLKGTVGSYNTAKDPWVTYNHPLTAACVAHFKEHEAVLVDSITQLEEGHNGGA